MHTQPYTQAQTHEHRTHARREQGPFRSRVLCAALTRWCWLLHGGWRARGEAVLASAGRTSIRAVEVSEELERSRGIGTLMGTQRDKSTRENTHMHTRTAHGNTHAHTHTALSHTHKHTLQPTSEHAKVNLEACISVSRTMSGSGM